MDRDDVDAMCEVATLPPSSPCGYSQTDTRSSFDAKLMASLQSADKRKLTKLSSKVVILGNANVGKTSLIARLVEHTFTRNYQMTIGLSFRTVTYRIMNQRFDLHLWDTAGQEKFRSISKAYYRGTDCCLLCFDVTDRESFEGTRAWYKELLQNAAPCAMFLVGLKSDLSRVITSNEAAQLACDVQAEYWEVSACEDVNVQPLFQRCAAVLFEHALRHTLSPSYVPTAAGRIRMVPRPLEQHPQGDEPGCCT